MATALYNDDRITFVCGRNFTYNGHDYQVGDDMPMEDLVSNPEAMVRSRHLIPVVDDMSDRPRQFHREVQDRALVLKKLGIEQDKPKAKKKAEKVESKSFDPAEHNVDEVLEYLTGDIDEDEYNRVIEAEKDGKARKGILGEEE